MKAVFLVVYVVMQWNLGFGQGTIQSVTFNPSNPTVLDTIEIISSFQFPSGDCELDNQGISLSGNTYYAYAHHCLGMLTVICNTADTFYILPGQAPGNYSLDLTLTSGAAPAPCTPGIAIDDHEVYTFTITDVAALTEIDGEGFVIYPNPVNTFLTVKGAYDFVEIADLNGKVLIRQDNPHELINVIDLEPGFYLIGISKNNHYRIFRIQVY